MYSQKDAELKHVVDVQSLASDSAGIKQEKLTAKLLLVQREAVALRTTFNHWKADVKQFLEVNNVWVSHMLDLVKVHLPRTITKSLEQVKENYEQKLQAAIDTERADRVQREA